MISLFLWRAGERIPVVLADRDSPDARTWGLPCPECGARALNVRGAEPLRSADGRAWESHAYAACCGARLGMLRYEPPAVTAESADLAVFGEPPSAG